MTRTAIVVGAGIGGLAAALGLRRAGWAVHVVERSASLGEVGAGISIWANGLAALDTLGVGDAVRAAGLPGEEGWIRDRNGAPLLELGSDELRRRHGTLGVMLYRPELHRILLEAVGAGGVRLGAELREVVDEGTRVAAVLRDGTSVEGDVLIGADGLRSRVRARLHGDTPPSYAGYTAWRAVFAAPDVPLVPGESWGLGARFGHARVAGDRVYVWATESTAEGGRGRDGELAELRRLFCDWHDPIPALLDAMRGARILRHDVYDRPPLRRWGIGRVTLLGDAAHPMTPNLGQGACQALEDAVVLARRLGEVRSGGDAAAALRAYEAARVARANAFVVRSRRAGEMGQWRNPLAVRIRGIATRAVLARLQPRQMRGMLAFHG